MGECHPLTSKSPIESTAHCLKLIFQARNADQPLEIYLHTTQAIDLVHKLSLTICELHRRDSELLLESKYGLEPALVLPAG